MPVDSVQSPIASASHADRSTGPYKRSVIAIGASTGGTEATNEVLKAFGPEAPGILIVQHMGAHFMAAYAERLNANHRIEVKIAEEELFEIMFQGTRTEFPGLLARMIRRHGWQLVNLETGSCYPPPPPDSEDDS